MKKTLCIILSLITLMTLSLFGCDGENEKSGEAEASSKEESIKTESSEEISEEESLTEAEAAYRNALALYDAKDFKQARAEFYKLGDYKDSIKMFNSILSLPTTQTYYLSDGTDEYTVELGYDERGNIAFDDYFRYAYEYYENGDIKKMTRSCEDADDELSVYTYSRTEKDGITTVSVNVVRTRGEGEYAEEYEATNEYIYDANGNLLREDIEGYEASHVTEYVYGDDGHIKESVRSTFEGEWTCEDKSVYTLDENGNVIKEVLQSREYEGSGDGVEFVVGGYYVYGDFIYIAK